MTEVTVPMYRKARTDARRPLMLAWVSAVCLLAIPVAAGIVDPTPTEEPAPEIRPVSVLPATGDVTISWDVRTATPVRLRLYSATPNGVERLVGEFIAEAGVSSFETVDTAAVPGARIYRLKVTQIDGSETTIGSLFCVEPQFNPGSSVSPDTDLRPAAVLADRRLLTDDGSMAAVDSDGRPRLGFSPCPEPPVPRRS